MGRDGGPQCARQPWPFTGAVTARSAALLFTKHPPSAPATPATHPHSAEGAHMRLSTLILGLALSALIASSGFAATYKTPEALLQALYSFDTDSAGDDAPSPYSTFFSD